MNPKVQTHARAAASGPGEFGASAFSFRRQPLALAVFAAILAAYLLLLTKNYYWDGIFFAQTIEDAPDLNPNLLHPNHLIYNVLGYVCYRAARSLGLEVRAVEVLQILNCLIATLSAYVFFRILLECFKSVYLSITLTLLFALSATWWKFATDADSYIPSVLFLLISFRLILPGRRPRPFLAAIAHALSMCFHQLAALFFPVILLGLWLQSSTEPRNRRLASAFQYGLTAFLITFPLFYYSFYLLTGTFALKPFFHWVTNFSPEHGFTFNAWDNLTYTLRGHSRLFVGGRLGFLRDLRDPFMFALLGVVLIIALVFFYRLVRHFRELKTGFRKTLARGREHQALRRLTVVWTVCYLLFLFFFIPQNTFYRLFYLPALILLLGTYLAPYESAPNHPRRYLIALFVALAAAANLTFSAYPYATVRANPPLALALEMNRAWPPGTSVYVAVWNSDNGLVRYFNPSAAWREVDRESFERELRNGAGAGGQVWLETTLIDLYQSTPEGRAWLEAHTIRHPEHELVNSKYKLQFYRLRPETFASESTEAAAQ